MPSLRKALKDVAMEKDAAVVARVIILFKTLSLSPGCLLILIFHNTYYILHVSAGGPFSTASYAKETS